MKTERFLACFFCVVFAAYFWPFREGPNSNVVKLGRRVIVVEPYERLTLSNDKKEEIKVYFTPEGKLEAEEPDSVILDLGPAKEK